MPNQNSALPLLIIAVLVIAIYANQSQAIQDNLEQIKNKIKEFIGVLVVVQAFSKL